jgi:hypothetical protein
MADTTSGRLSATAATDSREPAGESRELRAGQIATRSPFVLIEPLCRYGRDMPVVTPSRKSPPRTLLIGPGMPTQVVVPSVSRAALLQGTAGTVRVETPSDATLSKPASVAGSIGPPTSGGPPDRRLPLPVGGDTATGGVAVLEVCAKAADAKRANTAATKITRIGSLLWMIEIKNLGRRRFRPGAQGPAGTASRNQPARNVRGRWLRSAPFMALNDSGKPAGETGNCGLSGAGQLAPAHRSPDAHFVWDL